MSFTRKKIIHAGQETNVVITVRMQQSHTVVPHLPGSTFHNLQSKFTMLSIAIYFQSKVRGQQKRTRVGIRIWSFGSKVPLPVKTANVNRTHVGWPGSPYALHMTSVIESLSVLWIKHRQFPHFRGKETDLQRGCVTFPRSHCWSIMETGKPLILSGPQVLHL